LGPPFAEQFEASAARMSGRPLRLSDCRFDEQT
jgi:hypothetical protein